MSAARMQVLRRLKGKASFRQLPGKMELDGFQLAPPLAERSHGLLKLNLSALFLSHTVLGQEQDTDRKKTSQPDGLASGTSPHG
jgi:hypothetical protein